MLSDVCEVQCWENNVPEAVTTAREIASATARAGGFADIARVQAKESDIPGAAQSVALAVEVAEAITDSADRTLTHAGIAEIQLDAIKGRSQV